MTDLVLSAANARILTDEAKADARSLWNKLERLYAGGAHTALGFGSWADYCAAEFNISSSAAYRLIDAGRVAQILASPSGEQPANEAVARELAPLRSEPEQLREAWSQATEAYGPKPTAPQVRSIVRGLASAEDLDKDPRYLALEDAVAILDRLPTPDDIVWPSEDYDVAQVEAAVLWMRRHWPAILDSWRQQRRALSAAKREEKATARRVLGAAT